jgi:O-antigen/teichoic acid export membrane protein
MMSLRSSKWTPWLRRILGFFLGQGTSMILQLGTGFALVRWLSVADFAQLSVATAFQNSAAVFVDLGTPQAVTALIGERASDPHHVGKYVRAVRSFRTRLFLAVAVVIATLLPFFVRKHQWPWWTLALLLISILASVYFQAVASVYTPPLLLARRFRIYYAATVTSGAVRAAAIVVLHFLFVLSGWTAAWLGALAFFLTAAIARRGARDLLVEPEQPDAQAESEILSFVLPLMPSVALFAVQGQLTVLLTALLGKTNTIAEIAALGRLGQVYALLGAANGVLIGPAIASSTPSTFRKKYLFAASIAFVLSFGLVVLGFVAPAPLLWLIGPRYEHLHREVGWILVASGAAYVNAVLATMNRARKWVWWWSTIFEVAVVVLGQAIVIALIDLSTAHGAVTLAVAASAATLAASFATGVVGLWQHGRHAEPMPRD